MSTTEDKYSFLGLPEYAGETTCTLALKVARLEEQHLNFSLQILALKREQAEVKEQLVLDQQALISSLDLDTKEYEDSKL